MRNLLLTLSAVLLLAPATLSAKRNDALTYASPESVKMDGDYLNRTIDSIANASIENRCFPGCQILVARKGKIVLHKSYGYHTYECERAVENSHLYDMASCTKVMAATICLMKLADEGKRVIAAGLDQDFKGEPFGPTPELMSAAEFVDKIQAICMQCGNPATRTQRLIDGRPASYHDPIILVGAKESYEARCRKCHQIPGK